MRITNYLNTNKEEVKNKTHNIWIGISLGNKYFTKEHIKEYLKWAAQHTKDGVLIVVADYIHAINLEILDHRTPHSAMKKALALGNEKLQEIEKIINELPQSQKEKINLVRWGGALNNTSYRKNFKIIKTEFAENKKFHKYLCDLMKAGRSDRADRIARLSKKEMNRFAEYLLNELPHFIDGVRAYDKRIYTLLIYPKLSKLDALFIGLQNKTMFPKLARKLHITHKIGIIEARAD